MYGCNSIQYGRQTYLRKNLSSSCKDLSLEAGKDQCGKQGAENLPHCWTTECSSDLWDCHQDLCALIWKHGGKKWGGKYEWICKYTSPFMFWRYGDCEAPLLQTHVNFKWGWNLVPICRHWNILITVYQVRIAVKTCLQKELTITQKVLWQISLYWFPSSQKFLPPHNEWGKWVSGTGLK